MGEILGERLAFMFGERFDVRLGEMFGGQMSERLSCDCSSRSDDVTTYVRTSVRSMFFLKVLLKVRL